MRFHRCFGLHLFPTARYHWSVTFDTYNGRVPQGTPLRGIIVPILSRILLCLNVLAEMAQQLKELRNLGAHDAEDEVTNEDVPTIISFLEAILEYLYVAPAKIAVVRARLKKSI
jgi:hypothetical protein